MMHYLATPRALLDYVRKSSVCMICTGIGGHLGSRTNPQSLTKKIAFHFWFVDVTVKHGARRKTREGLGEPAVLYILLPC